MKKIQIITINGVPKASGYAYVNKIMVEEITSSNTKELRWQK